MGAKTARESGGPDERLGDVVGRAVVQEGFHVRAFAEAAHRVDSDGGVVLSDGPDRRTARRRAIRCRRHSR
jgi:hypothetical protein